MAAPRRHAAAIAVLLVLSLAFCLGAAAARADGAGPPAFDEAAALDRSVASLGSFGRIGRVFAKARRGEPITIAAIGGSVTQGAWASSTANRYLDRVAAWWHAQFPSAPLRVVNAGIGGTNSAYGALRADRDLLSRSPDFVIVEFSVNDERDEASVESYEGLVRKILHAPGAPALLLLALCDASGGSAQPQHLRVARYYTLPLVSFSAALQPLLVPLASDFYAPDGLHPNDRGHALIALMVTHWLDLALASSDGQQDKPLTRDGFDDTVLLAGPLLKPASAQGWSYQADTQSWNADQPGATLAVTVAGASVLLSYLVEHGPRGELAVTVDDRAPVVVDGWIPQTYGGQLRIREIARDLPPGPHRVTLRLLEASNPQSQGHAFRVFGLGASAP